MSEDSKVNAEIRAKLTEEVRKVVREEVQATANRLESIDKNVNDLREKVGEAAGTLKVHTGLLIALAGGVLGIAYAALRVKVVGLPETAASAAPEPSGRLHYAAMGLDASPDRYDFLLFDGGPEGRLPPLVPNAIGKQCATACKDSVAPTNCAAECVKNSCWKWCGKLAIPSNEELRECVSRCFHASVGSEPMRTYLGLPFQLPDASPEDYLPLAPEEPPDGSRKEPADAGRDK